MTARPHALPPAQATDAAARAVGAVTLAALAMIHVADLPATLGPLPLIGAGYLAIIASAAVAGALLIARPHRLVWAAAGGLAAAAMGGYADPHHRRLPRRSRRRRQLALPARPGRVQRRNAARPARRLAGPHPPRPPGLPTAARHAPHLRRQPPRLTSRPDNSPGPGAHAARTTLHHDPLA